VTPNEPTSLPLPPRDLLRRIGPMGDEDPTGVYEETGRMHRQLLEGVLPDDWSWQGKRVLDFGCGVGRVLRQFAPEAGEAEFWGCDLDRPSLDWLEANLSPPFNFFESGETPGLDQADGSFDLIYAYSVYTHFTDNWAGWLREHHRVLADGGLLFATFLGKGMLEPLTGETWDEDQIGMNPLMHGYPWDRGGPIAINSPWWIRAHWGRAFEIVELLPVIEEGVPSHGIILARKKPVEITVEELTALEPDEPRELRSIQHHVEQLADETTRLRNAHEVQAGQLEDLRPLGEELERVKTSPSWRLTAPLRAAKQRLRQR
jgi:SAM-dependent methyltransferase